MEAPGIVVAPGVYDCITARLVEVAASTPATSPAPASR